MFDLNSLDAELKQLKAQTLSEYGKKIEIAIEMITKKERILNREEKILLKIDNLIKKSGFFKRKKLKELRDRVDRKIIMLKCELSKLKDLKERYINDYKNQREYLGLYDHEFVDKFFQ
ncbi:MAG: hypothetical protein N3C60_00075 [Calditerrivibrio sp.]|nr:hypothetical protein [Calditerrivibrio sp.]